MSHFPPLPSPIWCFKCSMTLFGPWLVQCPTWLLLRKQNLRNDQLGKADPKVTYPFPFKAVINISVLQGAQADSGCFSGPTGTLIRSSSCPTKSSVSWKCSPANLSPSPLNVHRNLVRTQRDFDPDSSLQHSQLTKGLSGWMFVSDETYWFLPHSH